MDSAQVSLSAALRPLAAALGLVDSPSHRSNVAFLGAGAVPDELPAVTVHVPQGTWPGSGPESESRAFAALRADIAEAGQRMDSAQVSLSAALRPLAAALGPVASPSHQSKVAFLSAGAAPVDVHAIRDGSVATEPLRAPAVALNVIVKEDLEGARQDTQELDRLRAEFFHHVDELKAI